jgi:hypothetical protein
MFIVINLQCVINIIKIHTRSSCPMCATYQFACPGFTSESCVDESGCGRAVYVATILFGELRMVRFERFVLVFSNQKFSLWF